MSLHTNVLTDRQQAVLEQLGPFAGRHGFYLGGGTAIALHIGHRRSVDFDWFCADAVLEHQILLQHLRTDGIPFQLVQAGPGSLQGHVADVRVSFFEYQYPPLAPLVDWPNYGHAVAGLDDLACMKLSAIAQRGAKKEFVDLYALVRRHGALAQRIDLYRKNYQTDDVAHLLYVLAYFDDADEERMPAMMWDVGWRQIKNALRRWTRGLAT